ncbi:MAG: tetratricopeptide repeat protein [Cyanobacteria bacterium REEB67]|nr:tetratricopeptide repeat protein [Cyanobacteria bacterium REEB67]
MSNFSIRPRLNSKAFPLGAGFAIGMSVALGPGILLSANPAGAQAPKQISAANKVAPQAVQAAADNGTKYSATQIEKLLKSAPEAYSTHLAAGKFYEEKGIIGEAQNEYRTAITCPHPSAEAYKHLAQLLLKSADYAEAEKVARAGLKLFPHEYGMLLTTGYVLHNEHKLGEAAAMYEAAKAVQPNNAEIYIALADVYSAMNQAPRALQYVEKALSLGKPTELTLYEQAKVLILLGRFDQALKPLAANFEANPLNFKNNKLYLNVLTSQKRIKEAFIVQLCLLAPANDKEMAVAKASLQDMLRALPEKEAQNGISTAEAAIKEKRLKGRLHFALGDVYDRIGQPQNAIGQYQAGLALDPTLARGYLRLGEDLENFKKDFFGAMKNYQKALSLDGKDKETTMRINQLKAKMK